MTRWTPCLPPLAFAVACGTAPPIDTALDSAPATAHWMADVFPDGADVPLGRVLLPGAFNSTSYTVDAANGISPDAPAAVVALWGSDDNPDEDNRERVVGWSKTQDHTLAQQLEDGIRFLELNVTMKDGVITTWHSVYGVPLDDVLGEVVSFAAAQREEVVVLTFGLSLDTTDWPRLAEILTAPRADDTSLCDLLYQGPEDAPLATISAVRDGGRNLVWMPDAELRAVLDGYGCVTSPGTTDRTWSLTDTPEGVEAALEASVDTRDPDHLLVNDFAFSLDGADSSLAQAQYVATYSGVQEASEALGFAGDFPGDLIEGYDTSGNMNVFAGAYYQDTNVVEAAIAANRGR